MKKCNRCRKNKPIEDFIPDESFKQKNKKYTLTCLSCRAERLQRRANKQFYILLFEAQNGCCAICKKHESQLKQKLAVDHNHKTGVIRGLICKECNLLLGRYEKHKKEFEKYLRTAPQRMIKIYKELLEKGGV